MVTLSNTYYIYYEALYLYNAASSGKLLGPTNYTLTLRKHILNERQKSGDVNPAMHQIPSNSDPRSNIRTPSYST